MMVRRYKVAGVDRVARKKITQVLDLVSNIRPLIKEG